MPLFITTVYWLIQCLKPIDSTQTLSLTSLSQDFWSFLPSPSCLHSCYLLTTSPPRPKAARPSFGGDPAIDVATAPTESLEHTNCAND